MSYGVPIFYPWTSGFQPPVGGNSAGGGNPIPLDARIPYPPQNFNVIGNGDGTFTATWNDRGALTGHSNGQYPNATPAAEWIVVVAAGELGGSISGSPVFPSLIKIYGTIVGSMPGRNSGLPMRFIGTSPIPGGIWVSVYGVSAQGTDGIPAYPKQLYSNIIGAGAPDPVKDQALVRTPFTDADGTQFVTVDASFTAPGKAGLDDNFAGVSLHVVGLEGSATPRECGNLIVYDRPTGGGKAQGSTVFKRDTHAVTFYFVSIGKDGSRVDYTTSPSVFLAGGIV